MTVRSSRSGQFGRREAIRLLGAGAGLGLITALREEAGLAAQSSRAAARRLTFPKGAIIRTALKDESPEALAGGATLFHEHLSSNYASPPATRGQSGAGAPGRGDAPSDIALMVEELRQTREDGVGCLVDSALTRRTAGNVANLRKISEQSGMRIVLGGGYYKAPYPPAVVQMSEDQLADQFVQDADAQRWGAFGEIGSSLETHPDERKMIRAVSKAHQRNGLPIFTHTPHESCPKCALEQLDLYESQGVDPRSVCIGHLSAIKLEDDPRVDTHKAIAKRGAFIGFDTVGHQMTQSHIPEAQKVKQFLLLLEAGCEDNIMLSSDFAQDWNLKANWGNGFSSVVLEFVPKLRYAGVKEATIHKILVDNPRRFLAFVPKTST